mmetsp:Transcript_25107/g.24856  ORF Transcript_25107/g.24856 Transcript_25107/m.24856 type:complete len:358 (-) Transcript_25107:43-1116(-)|eukprot:CAMPEP_0197011070 /NCGR_PEP_ID=MMETSP1380-20130617/56965_1 /TAXON_ID=5936 /ORGANISM="Euplotes crassus, Strain CT5" /LENGTH=357 /DNA_ID=CAMNT_0042433455 /DNA_START=16 /DNA_END=1089 /DNA_ORIENTATION=+
MESILEVANLVIYQHYKAVIEKATAMLADASTAKDSKDNLYFYRAVAHSELGDFESALKDLEAIEDSQGNNPDWLFRYGQAQFYTNDFSNSMISFKKAEESTEDADLKGNIQQWISKAELELGNPHVGNINDAIFITKAEPSATPVPSPDCSGPVIEGAKDIKDSPHDWYQNTEFIFLSILKKKNTGDWKADLYSGSINITQPNGDVISVHLANVINEGESTFTQTEKKVELKLKKKDSGITWTALSKEALSAKPKEVLPSYPSSSKKSTNWGEVDKTITRELHLEERDNDGDGMNDLFQQIYAGADEETKKAMIKSYQTSNGTVLSTNWDEVKEKDYEGKDYVSPPDDFVAQKPEI